VSSSDVRSVPDLSYIAETLKRARRKKDVRVRREIRKGRKDGPRKPFNDSRKCRVECTRCNGPLVRNFMFDAIVSITQVVSGANWGARTLTGPCATHDELQFIGTHGINRLKRRRPTTADHAGWPAVGHRGADRHRFPFAWAPPGSV